MVIVHPQYITDTSGSKLVVLSSKEFDSMIDALEELDDIQAYDEFKRTDDGKRVLLSDYLKKRELKNV
jgi:PHD/YefM family antitoxin component YafN of YafNO toxin-antitoxin module